MSSGNLSIRRATSEGIEFSAQKLNAFRSRNPSTPFANEPMKLLKSLALILLTLVAIYLATGVSLYLAGWRSYRIPSDSMAPTIHKGEHVFGRLSEGYRDHIKRFDIIIYRLHGALYAKRVIGLPGEEVIISNNLTINHKELNLPPSVNNCGLLSKPCDITVPLDSVFVLGDNTLDSLDSRYIGPIPKQQIIGRIFFKK